MIIFNDMDNILKKGMLIYRSSFSEFYIETEEDAFKSVQVQYEIEAQAEKNTLESVAQLKRYACYVDDNLIAEMLEQFISKETLLAKINIKHYCRDAIIMFFKRQKVDPKSFWCLYPEKSKIQKYIETLPKFLI